MQSVELHPILMDSLPVTLISLTGISTPSNYSLAIILLTNSLTNSPSPSTNLTFEFKRIPVSFLTAYNRPNFLTDSFSYSFSNICSFPFYIHFTLPANTPILSSRIYPLTCLLFEPFLFHSFLWKPLTIVSWWYQALSFLVTLNLTWHIYFLSCWQIYLACLPERKQWTLTILSH